MTDKLVSVSYTGNVTTMARHSECTHEKCHSYTAALGRHSAHTTGPRFCATQHSHLCNLCFVSAHPRFAIEGALLQNRIGNSPRCGNQHQVLTFERQLLAIRVELA